MRAPNDGWGLGAVMMFGSEVGMIAGWERMRGREFGIPVLEQSLARRRGLSLNGPDTG